MVGIGFEDSVARTLLAIPNTNTKVNSKDVPTAIQPQKGSATFRKPGIDRDDDENKAHWAEKTLEQMSTRDCILQGDFQIFIRGVQVPSPMQVRAENELLRELLEAVHTVGYAKPTLIRMQAYVKKLPPLDDTTAQDGPYATILAPRRELVSRSRGPCSS